MKAKERRDAVSTFLNAPSYEAEQKAVRQVRFVDIRRTMPAGIYRETAKEMGLPESSPAKVVTIQPGTYSLTEDWVKSD